MQIGKYTIVSFSFNEGKSYKGKSFWGTIYYYFHYPLLPIVFAGTLLAPICCITCFFIPVIWLSGVEGYVDNTPIWSVILAAVFGLWGVYWSLRWARYLVTYFKQKIIVVECVFVIAGVFLALMLWGLFGVFSIIY